MFTAKKRGKITATGSGSSALDKVRKNAAVRRRMLNAPREAQKALEEQKAEVPKGQVPKKRKRRDLEEKAPKLYNSRFSDPYWVAGQRGLQRMPLYGPPLDPANRRYRNNVKMNAQKMHKEMVASEIMFAKDLDERAMAKAKKEAEAAKAKKEAEAAKAKKEAEKAAKADESSD